MLIHVLRKLRIRIVIRRYEVILFGGVMLLSGAVMPSNWYPPPHFLPPPPVMEPLPKHPWIAFTFDDGPHPILTEQLLKVLREEHVPGTFFVVGKMADRYPTLLQAIAREGHEIGNHTYNHPNLSRLSDEAVMNELNQTRRAILRLTGQNTVLFRPPGGDFRRQTVRLTAKAGYRMVLWTILTDDVDGASARTLRRRILEGAQDGGIILMHSGVGSTIKVLPEVIAKLRQEGYHFVTVSTLMGLSKPHLPATSPEALTVQTVAVPHIQHPPSLQ